MKSLAIKIAIAAAFSIFSYRLITWGYVMVSTREIRATAGALYELRTALERFKDDTGGRCPRDLSVLIEYGIIDAVPHDGWGQPLQMICPTGKTKGGVVIVSNGSDGTWGTSDDMRFMPLLHLP